MKKILLAFLILFAIFRIENTLAQGLPKAGASGESDRIEGKFKFVPLPLVDYDRAVGFTLGAVPVAMLNLSEKDTISPSSTIGLLGMYSENKTWFAMGFGMFYLNEDKWRILVAGGLGDINYQFYASNPINRWFRYNTNADFAFLGIQRRIIPNLYAGINYVYTTFKTNSDFYSDSTATELHGIGFDGVLDRRSNVSYPRSGYLIEFDFTTFPKFIGNQDQSNQLTFSYNHYFSFRKKRDVFATRFFTGIAIGDVNFNQQFIVGGTDIRGYSFGKSRGNSLLAIQGEYRWNFYNRVGLVGFAALATLFGADNQEDNGRIFPGIGSGFRYVFMKETHSTIGFDIAVGDGDWGFYFRLSEAF